MKIETKYSPGDKVFVMLANSIHRVTIDGIYITAWSNKSPYRETEPSIIFSVTYHVKFKGGDIGKDYPEVLLYEDQEKLIDSVRRPYEPDTDT